MKKILYPTDIDRQTDDLIRETLRAPVPESSAVKAAKEAAFDRVREIAGAQAQECAENDTVKTMYTRPRGKEKIMKHRIARTIGSIAAAAAVFSGVCVVNPAFAAKVPLVGHVFEHLGTSLGFGGDFSEYAVPLTEPELSEETVRETETGKEMQDAALTAAEEWQDGVYTKTSNGVTVSLSEVYCNEAAMYVSLLIHTEDAFPETAVMTDGAPIINLMGSTLQFSYNPDVLYGDYLDGRMIDDHTYAGVLRVDLADTLRYAVIDESTAEEKQPSDEQITYETVELPETFSVDLDIRQIIGDKADAERPQIPQDLWDAYEQGLRDAGLATGDDAYASYTEEEQDIEHTLFTQMYQAYTERYPGVDAFPNAYENWWVEGEWDFSFEVTVDHSATEEQTLTDEKNPIGDIVVTLTPFELTLTYDEANALDYFVAVLDADGMPMGSGSFGGRTDVHPTFGHDTSKVYVYVCDYNEYMDELKGYYWSEDYGKDADAETFQELLTRRCVWGAEVDFSETTG